MESVAQESTVSKPLYPPTSILLASMVGSPLAGLHLMARNYKRAGQPQAARRLWLAGIAGFILLAAGLALAYTAGRLPSQSNLPAAVVIAALMSALATKLQGDLVKAHQSAGGKVSRGGEVAVGWAIVIVAIVVGLPWIITLNSHATSPPPEQKSNAVDDSALPVNGIDAVKDMTKIRVLYEGLDAEVAQRCGGVLLDGGLEPIP